MRKDSEKKTKLTSIRMTEEQYNTIKAMADQKQMKTGEYLVDSAIHGHSLTPEAMILIQEIVNKAYRTLAAYSPFDAENLQDEVDKIWTLLK
ncbi:MAG: hypothetical protein K2I06_02885 [Ruminococcus sp.]|nr:hypothetical protein [Ruminococcus sp.]